MRFRDSVVRKLVMRTAPVACPFPGRFPTRLWIKWTDGTVYVGKPFLLMKHQRRLSELKEFDRAGVICRVNTAKKVRIQEPIFCAYHPGIAGNWRWSRFVTLMNSAFWFGKGVSCTSFKTQVNERLVRIPFYYPTCLSAKEAVRRYHEEVKAALYER